MDFNQKLRSAGISKSELGKRLGISPSTISRWETPPDYAVTYVDLLLAHKTVSEEAEVMKGVLERIQSELNVIWG